MKRSSILILAFYVLAFALVVSTACAAWGADGIPKAAWKRPLGLPLENPGVTRVPGNIDDGYWQGAPVGGFGAGTFSRSYRGDFVRWHIKAGVHKYAPVYADQFAMFQQAEGAAHGVARALMNGHPPDGELSDWQWDYPVGAGDYYALFPKAWFDYKWDRFPAHVVLEQFSPVIPNNYRESSYPVAVYRWHAENPTHRAVTVSVLLPDYLSGLRRWQSGLGPVFERRPACRRSKIVGERRRETGRRPCLAFYPPPGREKVRPWREMGAVNGMAPDGSVLANEQAKEVWVGVTFAYAGLLLSEGMKQAADKTAWGLYHVIYESKSSSVSPIAEESSSSIRVAFGSLPWIATTATPRFRKSS